MKSTKQEGFLLLADISGFTSFLAKSELDHAQEILSKLIQHMIAQLTPTFKLAEVEGDAVFVYTPAEKIPSADSLLEFIESAYIEFRELKDSSDRLSKCECEACRMAPNLDIKFIVHFGEYVLQNIQGRKKPMGNSVNLVHRLLKNGISEQTGWNGYALLTGECITHLNISTEHMLTHFEEDNNFGEIQTFSVNLEEVYQSYFTSKEYIVEPETAHVALTYDFPFPPYLVWEWLNDPTKRRLWMKSTEMYEKERPRGFLGPGAVNHCTKSKFNEYIRSWRPFKYFTVENIRGIIKITETSQLEPSETGTTLKWVARLNGKLPRWFLRGMCRIMVNKILHVEKSWKIMADLMNEANLPLDNLLTNKS